MAAGACLSAVEVLGGEASWNSFPRWMVVFAVFLAARSLLEGVSYRLLFGEYTKAPKAANRGVILTAGRVYRGIALLLWAAWFMALTLILLPPFDPTVVTILGLVAMWVAIWPIGMMVMTSYPVVLITQREIVQVLPKGRRRRIRFDEITKVTSGYCVYGADGKRVVVVRGVIGTDVFAQMILDRVPKKRFLECIDEIEYDAKNPPGAAIMP